MAEQDGTVSHATTDEAIDHAREALTQDGGVLDRPFWGSRTASTCLSLFHLTYLPRYRYRGGQHVSTDAGKSGRSQPAPQALRLGHRHSYLGLALRCRKHPGSRLVQNQVNAPATPGMRSWASAMT